MRKTKDYLLKYCDHSIEELTEFLFTNVFREQFEKPGFAVIDFGTEISSRILREFMVELKKNLSERLILRNNSKLNYQWMGRFNQQSTTKFHRDNAGDQSFLMLGYEPSEIESKLFFADYSKYSQERNLSDNDFFTKHNPIFINVEDQLSEYVTEVQGFEIENYKLVLMNNSSLRLQETHGVLHKAEIIKKDLGKSRVINSTMIYKTNLEEEDPFNKIAQMNFINTIEISK